MILYSGGSLPELTDTHAIITGVAGFLGKCLARQLLSAGAQVHGLDVHDNSADLPEAVEYHRVDIVKLDKLCEVLTELHFPPDRKVVVFHLAGQSRVGECRSEPSSAIALNVTGTSNLLDACRRAHLTRVIFPSTALVYSAPAPGPLDEDAALWPKSVYAATKLAAEALLKGYSADYGFSCCIARLGNVYGPGGASDSVVSILLRQVQRGGPISLRSLAPVRDFVYRDDVASGLIALAAHRPEPGCRVFNLSSGIPTSIRELALAACRVGDLETSITECAAQPCDADDRLVLSIRRLVQSVGWRPRWMLEDALRQTLSEMARRDHD
jgi:UDP-glucose 4-epimerase